jgi:WD40 repeat protein
LVVLGSPSAVVTSASRDGIHSWSWATGGDVCAGPDRELLALCATERAATAALTGVGAVEAAPSPDGSHLAVLDRKGAVWMYAVDPAAGSSQQPLWQTPPARELQGIGPDEPILWSPDGARLLVERSKHDVLDATTGAIVHLKEKFLQYIGTAVWLDNHSIGAWMDNTRLRVYSASTGVVVRMLPKGTAGLAMSNPVGHQLAVDQEVVGDDVSIIDTRDGTRDQALVGIGGEVEALTLSPDGLFVATGEEGGGIHIWETTSGAQVLSTSVGHDVMGLVFESDDVLYENGMDDGVRRVDCPSCATGPALLKLAASHITAPLDDAEAVQFGVTKDQRQG